jgi:hypothetical protein
MHYFRFGQFVCPLNRNEWKRAIKSGRFREGKTAYLGKPGHCRGIAFVHSHILYGIEIYANTCLTYLDKLIKLNNKLLRIIQHQQHFCHVRDLYMSYYTLTVPELHTQQLLTLVHKALYHGSELPDVFSDYFTRNISVHDHETRSKSDIHIYKANSAFGQRSVTYKGGFLWNNLPPHLTTTDSTRQFKLLLKHLFYELNQ